MQESVTSPNFHLTLPSDFDDYEWQTKGYYIGALLEFEGVSYQLNFYSPERLLQDIHSEIEETGAFLEQNMVVVREISRQALFDSMNEIVLSGRVKALIAMPNQ